MIIQYITEHLLSNLLPIYLWMWLIYSYSIIEKQTIRDIFISHLCGLLWPISLPGRIIKKLLQ